MNHDITAIEKFLLKVDKSFPVALSEKTDLHQFACKLHEKATICAQYDGQEMIAMVAGYTKNLVENRAYVSLVATCEKARRKGIAKKLVQQFLEICEEKGIATVHLYTAPTNKAAVVMYERLGFEKWNISNEPRPEDIHFIYFIKK